MIPALVSGCSTVFWDFDGVIKDSVDAKSRAFERLFEPYGTEIARRVRAHHEANGGMSRFEKLPVYLEWIGDEVSDARVRTFCERFSELALQSVIDAPWVPGAEEYLRTNPNRQTFVLVSATPLEELEQLLRTIRLRECFARVFGSPMSKREAIRLTLEDSRCTPGDCLMIGDARADYDAARAHDVPFLLRRHATNTAAFADYAGPSVRDFAGL